MRTRLGIKLTSTIDFFIVCENILPFVQEMMIDSDDRTIINFRKGKTTIKADHAPMWLKLNLMILPEKPEKVVVLNYKNKAGSWITHLKYQNLLIAYKVIYLPDRR